MNYGFVDPESVRMEGDSVLGDFILASDNRRLVLKVKATEAMRLDALLAAQLQHGIIHLRTDHPDLNDVETVRGQVLAENRTSGLAKLKDGREVTAEFPAGTFDEKGYYNFRGTGVVSEDVLNVFVADTIPADTPAHGMHP